MIWALTFYTYCISSNKNGLKTNQNKPCTSYLCSGAPGAQALNKPPLQRNRLFKGCSKTFRTNPSTTPRTSSRTSRPHKRPVQPPYPLRAPYNLRTSAVQAPYKRPYKEDAKPRTSGPHKGSAQPSAQRAPYKPAQGPYKDFFLDEIQYL